ncbi:hypothetical protein BGZ89_008619 [Linnemannia elongata]|nr:hypothetical protein BGZ89_008619 [Linnemannia elongata]
MERLEASTEFRPFKFRIQAFTNAFHDSLIQHGLTEDVLPLRKVKLYLWKHRYISRFNEDGKKQKSKGNHVWNIEARKISNVVPVSGPASGPGIEGSVASATPSVATPSTSSAASTPSIKASTTTTGFYDLLPPDMDPKQIGPEAISAAGGGLGIIRRPTSPVRWEFREYSSRIAGQVIKYARVGVPYVYSPRIWDAQMSCPAAKFSSPWLPSWLKWHRGELKGIPSAGDESCTIVVVAEYVREGEECRLEMSFPLTVCDPSKEMQEPHDPSGVSAEDDGSADGLYGGDSGGSAGAVGLDPSTGLGQDGADSVKMQTEEFSSLRQQHSRRENDGDEEMMMAMKEDEDMEQEHHEQVSSYNQHQYPYYSNYPSSHHGHQNQQPSQHALHTTSPRQQEHQREQRQAQQRLQRLNLQENHQHQQQQGEVDQKAPFFQPTTAPSSAGTTASFYMNPPSSRGSISSSNGSSAYVEEEESDEEEESGDDDDDDDDDESDGDDDDDEGGEAGRTRKMKTRTSTRTTTSTSGTRRGRPLTHRRKPSRDQRSTVPQETNKRRKHDLNNE